MTTLEQALWAFCQQYGTERTYWIAYSGGLDSGVLLHLLYELQKKLPLRLAAVHINHGVNQQAASWVKSCEAQCAQYNIDFHVQSINLLLLSGDSFEEAARKARYERLSTYLHPNDILLTAHQQDDQAETLLLQLLRGTGPRGLASMPAVKSLGRGLHARPLLPFSREMLQWYARHHQLKWIDDDSNENRRFTRNFIRRDIFPLLKQRWPSMAQTLSRSAAHCAEADQVLQEVVQSLLLSLGGSQEATLSVQGLLSLSPAKQRLILRGWIDKCGFPLPDTRKLETIRHTVLTAAWDKLPCVRWKNTELRRYRDDLFLMAPSILTPPPTEMRWDLHNPLSIPGIGRLTATRRQGGGLYLPSPEVIISYRQGGENMCLTGRGHHILKHLFQEWGVLPWRRHRLPLLYVESTDKQRVLACVPGYAIADGYIGQGDQWGYDISFDQNDADPQLTLG